MRSTMAHLPLTIPMIFRHGVSIHGRSVICSVEGPVPVTATFADTAREAARLASALLGMGIRAGDRVATLCWNHRAHMAAYLAIPSMGAVLHTLNCRLSAEQLGYIIEEAGNRIVIADASLAPLLADALSRVDAVEAVIFVGTPARSFDQRAAFEYTNLIAGQPSEFIWVEPNETDAAVICYTSGTTGKPKGVVYSHRSIFLHSLGSLGVDTFGICQSDRILLLPPMFHANAWGLPFAAWLSGADLILPGSNLHTSSLRCLIERERPTFTAAVPTLINDLLIEHRARPLDMSSFRLIVAGGSAVPANLVREVGSNWNVPVIQGWGMTETGPMCALTVVPPEISDPGELEILRTKSGRPVPGTELRLVDDSGQTLPHDGKAVGELQIRGIWVTGRYHADRSPESFTADGWVRSGDIGCIDEHGYALITDRAKDVIKSGGEWISSVALEAFLLEHGDVAEVAVIAVSDERWGERPLAVIVPAGPRPLPAKLRAHLLARDVARFWIPEIWAFVENLPRTSVGKIDKKALRAEALAGRFDLIREPAYER
jgi:fatty-acyl-CoA synthase